MIVANAKPLEEIWEQVKHAQRVCVLGCGECVTVCHAGGEKEVSVLAQALRLKANVSGIELEVLEKTVRRQCEPEFIQPILESPDNGEVVISLACGVGVNFLVDSECSLPVVPGLNTSFMGTCESHGLWTERCAGCGECILDLTGGLCPIARCAKTILNGPCGGTDQGMCEVSTPERPIPCIWVKILERAKQLGTVDRLKRVLACKDWSSARDGGPRQHVRPDLLQEPLERLQDNDPLPHPKAHLSEAELPTSANSEPVSHLHCLIMGDEFIVTAEMGPPKDADASKVIQLAAQIKGYADAVNVTDCQTAVVHMSSITASVLLQQQGVEPVMQTTTRDRNRIAIQADILGASPLGINNCLCIAGDHQKFSAVGKWNGSPGAKNVYDVDSIQCTAMLSRLSREGILQGGDPISVAPRLLLGNAWAPLGDPMEWRVDRLAKKIAAGAQFIQTQGVYDFERLAKVMEDVRARGLHKQAAILVGIIVPKSGTMLRYMDRNVPGISVPTELIERFPVIRKADPEEKKVELRKRAREVSMEMTIELIQACRQIEGIRGVHIQAIGCEEMIPEIVTGAGLYPRPERMENR